jgi:hypothetical protein
MGLHRREFLELAVGAGLALAGSGLPRLARGADHPATLILTGGRIATMDPKQSTVEALAVREGRVLAAGSVGRRTAGRPVIDQGRTAIPASGLALT